jgi:hypothetical protein
MELKDFQSLKVFDLVLLVDGAEVKHLLRSAVTTPETALPEGVDIVCRVEKTVAQAITCACGHDPKAHRTAPTVRCGMNPCDCIEIRGSSAYHVGLTLRSITFAGPPIALHNGRIRHEDGKPIEFFLNPTRILSRYPAGETEADRATSSLRTRYHRPDSALDRMAIQFPKQFIKTYCRWEWLPAPSHTAVRDRIARAPALPTGEQITDDAMRSLLEYRAWITQRLREEVATAAFEYSRAKRLEYALSRQHQSPEVAARFEAGTKPLGGDIPGSTELTSDIDINTFGDGTEFAVRQFNARFRELFEGCEAGIVFDVNLYGKDFLPNFGKPEFWRRDRGADEVVAAPLYIRPEFDHEFTGPKSELDDAGFQLRYGLAKLRRYMVDQVGEDVDVRRVENSWNLFCAYFRRDGASPLAIRFGDELVTARNQHLLWNNIVYTSWIEPASRQIAHCLGLAENPEVSMIREEEHAALTHERQMAEFIGADRPDHNRKGLMKAQNLLYEHFLEKQVEPSRMKFNYAKFAGGAPVERDALYLELRKNIGVSLYFANEAYVTCGGVLQVVGGKQQKSRKVGADYGLKQSFHNIAYTVHELMQSAVDQLADIHKEGHRHFHHLPPDRGGTLIATGKYIHRLLNAIKHMYWIFECFPRTVLPFTFFHKAAPAAVIGADTASTADPRPEAIAWWNILCDFGFGLEGLKKATFGDPQMVELRGLAREGASVEAFNRRVGELAQLKGVGTGYLLTSKFHLVKQPAMRVALETANKNALALFLAQGLCVGRGLFEIQLNSDPNFFLFFQRLVQFALEDYFLYCSLSSMQLRSVLKPNGPPFYWAHYRIVNNERVGEEELPVPPRPVPPRPVSPIRPRNWADEDDEYWDYEPYLAE